MSTFPKDTSEQSKTTAETVRITAGQAADAGRSATDKASEAGRKSADKAADVAHTAAREAADVAQHAAKTVQQSVRTGVDAATRVAERSTKQFDDAMGLSDQSADKVAEAGQHAVRAGADAARRGADTVGQMTQSGVNMAVEAMERSTDQFARAFGFGGQDADHVARRSARNVEAISDSGAVLVRGLQDISREWMGFTQARLQKNLDGLTAIMGCRTVQDVVAVQSDLLRDNLEMNLKDGRRLAELSVGFTGEAAQKMAVQPKDAMDSARRAA